MNANDQDYPVMMSTELLSQIEAAYAAFSQTRDAIQNWHVHMRQNSLMPSRDQSMPYGYPQSQELTNASRLSILLKQLLPNIINGVKIEVDLCSNINYTIAHDLNKQLAAQREAQKSTGDDCSRFDAAYLNSLKPMCECPSEMACEISSHIIEARGMIGTLSRYLGQMELPEESRILDNSWAQFNASLVPFMNASFIIKVQPPQVMKTNTKFQAEIRLLFSAKLLEAANLQLREDAEAIIINENLANAYAMENKLPKIGIGEILENKTKMEYDSESNQFVAIFRNLQLKKVRRAEKKGCESVMDEKFAILFSAKFVNAGGIHITASTMSLPVTVIVHGNQEPRAWATITWENGFSTASRKLFNTPNEVCWGMLAKVLNAKFTSTTGKSLSTNDLEYIGEKLFGTRHFNDLTTVTWSKFCKENLEKRNFTFWEWFYAIVKLITERLKKMWIDGVIHGFISKNEAEQKLLSCCEGTFLLRFSDSELGGISIAYVQGVADNAGYKYVTHVSPYTSSELSIQPLANKLCDSISAPVLYLYPDIQKVRAFGKYYQATEPQRSCDPYARRSQREEIIGVTMKLPPIPALDVSSQSDLNSSYSTFSASNSPSSTVSFLSDQHSFADANDDDISDNTVENENMDDFDDIPINSLISLRYTMSDV